MERGMEVVKGTTGIFVQGSEIAKNVSEVREKNAARKLTDILRKEAPALITQVKENLNSDTRRNETLSSVLQNGLDIMKEEANSAILRNQAQTWAAIQSTNSTKNIEAVFETTAISIGNNMGNVANNTHMVAKEIHGVHVIGKSLVDRIDYYGRFMQMAAVTAAYQAEQTIKVLTDISEHLGDSNSITVSGSGGPDGFARSVYDFIKMRIDQVEGDNHRFFVYHPDTNWYPAFHRLVRETPLPPTFCSHSNDLDKLCQYMHSIRMGINDLDEDANANERTAVFHLLIPAWYKIKIKEPLHFSDDLQPFCIEGQKHHGKCMIEFNLPAAPNQLLNGIANVLDANGANARADIAAGLTSTIATGWGVNGACLALGLGLGALTGMGVLLAIPVWWGSAVVAMPPAGMAIESTIHDALCEDQPRILGSTIRMNASPRR